MRLDGDTGKREPCRIQLLAAREETASRLQSKDGGSPEPTHLFQSPMVSVCSAKQKFGGSGMGAGTMAVLTEMPHNRAFLLLP